MRFFRSPGFGSIVGGLLGIGYWFLDAAVMAFIFHKGIFPELIFNPGADVIWTRLATLSLMVAFGIGVDIYCNNIKQREERLNLAIKGSNAGLWERDFEKDKVWCSPYYSELLGYKAGELTLSYQSFLDMLHAEDRDRMIDAFQGHLEQRIPSDIEFRLQTKSGEYRWFHGLAQAIRDKQGRPTRMSGSIHDITKRKQAEQERENAMKLLEQALREIKTLKGIIPICSYCKKIRDEENAWEKLEAYITEHTDAQFSHGICPQCVSKVHADPNYKG